MFRRAFDYKSIKYYSHIALFYSKIPVSTFAVQLCEYTIIHTRVKLLYEYVCSRGFIYPQIPAQNNNFGMWTTKYLGGLYHQVINLVIVLH